MFPAVSRGSKIVKLRRTLGEPCHTVFVRRMEAVDPRAPRAGNGASQARSSWNITPTMPMVAIA